MERTFEYIPPPIQNNGFEDCKDMILFLYKRLGASMYIITIREDCYELDEKEPLVTVNDESARKIINVETDNSKIENLSSKEEMANKMREIVDTDGSFLFESRAPENDFLSQYDENG